MSKLIHEGEPVRSNQFLYKAILIDTMMLMQSPSPMAQQRVQMQLSQTLEK